MASFSNAGLGFGAEPEEQAGLMGKASELAKGLQHPVPALFHLLFKVCHAPQARTHTARPCRLTWFAPDLVRADPGHHNLHVRRLVL